MAKNKKKLTKQERAQKQFAREQLHRKAKQDLLNAIEAHQFNEGDLVRVGDNVGVIASHKHDLLDNKWSIGKQAFEKVMVDFYALANWWVKEEDLPPQVKEYLGEFITATHEACLRLLEQEEFAATIDVPIACFENEGVWKVRSRTVMFNKQKDQYLVFNGMLDLEDAFDFNAEADESITLSEGGDASWFAADVDSIENATFQGCFDQMLDQAYAVKQKRSKNLGLYKVLYSGQMLGQKGKQQVWVAPCNIQAL